MKLFHFNPNNWGTEYYVMAANRIKALDALLKSFVDEFNSVDNEPFEVKKIEDFSKWIDTDVEELPDNISSGDFFCKFNAYEKYMLWKDVNPNNQKTFIRNYTLDAHGVDSVIESEIA